jgi:hypothetical protein
MLRWPTSPRRSMTTETLPRTCMAKQTSKPLRYCKRVPFSGWDLGSSGGGDYGGGDFVVGVEVEELDAGGGADWSGLGWKQLGHPLAVGCSSLDRSGCA